MSQHLIDNKAAFLALLSKEPAYNHHALARQYGWVLIDLSHACGYEAKSHAVDTRSSIADDLRVKPCPACNSGRGGWTYVPAAKPTQTPEQAAEDRKILAHKAAAAQAQAEAAEADAKAKQARALAAAEAAKLAEAEAAAKAEKAAAAAAKAEAKQEEAKASAEVEVAKAALAQAEKEQALKAEAAKAAGAEAADA